MRRCFAVFCVLLMSAAVLSAGSIPLDGFDDELKWMRHPGYLAEAEEGTPFGFELSGSADVSGLAFIADPVEALGSAADHLSTYMAAQDDAYLADNYEAIAAVFSPIDPGFPAAGDSDAETAYFVRDYFSASGRFNTVVDDANRARAAEEAYGAGLAEFPADMIMSDLDLGLRFFGNDADNGFGWNWNVDIFFNGAQSLFHQYSYADHVYGNDYGLRFGTSLGYGGYVYDDVLALGFTVTPQILFRSSFLDSDYIAARMSGSMLGLFAGGRFNLGASVDLDAGMYYRYSDELAFALDFRNIPSLQLYWYFTADDILGDFAFHFDENLYFEPFDAAVSVMWDRDRWHVEAELSGLYSQIIWQRYLPSYRIDPWSLFRIGFSYDINDRTDIYAGYHERTLAFGVRCSGFRAELSSRLDRLSFGVKAGCSF